jgi:probable HAF family extracellular repeat protein
MPTFSARLLLIGLCSLPATNTFAQQYTVTDLGTLGGDDTFVIAINSSGQITGSSSIQGSSPAHPFLWQNGVMQDLGTLPGFPACYATAINEHGQVVGSCQSGTVSGRAFIWSPAGGMTHLNLPDGAIPTAINSNGDIVGGFNGLNGTHAFLYRGGIMTDLGQVIARGINDSGQIVGEGTQPSHARLWDASGGHDLGTIDGGVTSFAMAISPGGLVVGNSDAGEPGQTSAVVWTPYGVSNLGTLGGPSTANAISGSLVVGTSTVNSGGHAFLYDMNGPGFMVDLNDEISPDAGWLLGGAVGVNAAGEIVGVGEISGQRRSFLLTPRAAPTPTGNLLSNGGFEEYTPPRLGPPGWVSDDYRQVAAKSETNQPRSGEKNGACWATDNLDCGMFQDVTAPVTGTYTLTIFANADRPGALVGANVNETTAASADVAVRGFANYGDAYVLTFHAAEGQTIRVWMYSPAVPGYLVIDDVTLTGPSS